MNRFVVLEHDHPTLHWDFMLERGPSLRTWRLAAPPAAGVLIAAEPIGDHRPAYLEFEGTVRGDRGRVVRWDHGTFAWLEANAERVVVRLEGTKLRGVFRLERQTGQGWVGKLDPTEDAGGPTSCPV
jgi:hypothetical protein